MPLTFFHLLHTIAFRFIYVSLHSKCLGQVKKKKKNYKMSEKSKKKKKIINILRIIKLILLKLLNTSIT